MKWLRPVSVSVVLVLPLLFLNSYASPSPELSPPIRVLLVTGGHGFQKDAFFKLFKDNPDLTYQAVEPPAAYACLQPEAAKAYDVMVLYD